MHICSSIFRTSFFKPVYKVNRYTIPTGKKVLIIENDGVTNELFNIKTKGKWVTTSVEAGTVATFIW